MTEDKLRNIIISTLQNHPRDCIFHPNVIENCMEACRPYLNHYMLIDILEKTFMDNEIYCPHEGIDRRSEYDKTRTNR